MIAIITSAAGLASASFAASSTCPSSFNPTDPASSGFDVVFEDTFQGTSLNPSNWCANYPSAPSCTVVGATTNQNQISSCDPANITVSNGAAHLLLTNTPSTDWAGDHYPTTGACMSTDGPQSVPGQPLHAFQPPNTPTGAIWVESKITLPDAGNGVAANVANEPSAWMNGVTPGYRICIPGWPNCGEIDYAEFYTGPFGPGLNGGDCTSYHHDPNDYQLALSVVGQSQARTTCTGTGIKLSGTHYYGALWTNTEISFYVDRQVVFTTTNMKPSSPMYLVFFNIADRRTVNVFPSTMDIHSVYVWSHD